MPGRVLFRRGSSSLGSRQHRLLFFMRGRLVVVALDRHPRQAQMDIGVRLRAIRLPPSGESIFR